ncbi:hypothetical protein [Burkholderia sp. Ac-20365]|uniref:hypothetical protein n=1 Tax=Burkholderia sp. Ac-20365 TaxID=2703897 RepID=UPI00197B6F77|nr:hypothetical protein [Burkholderia sp. Ac-20365]
MTNVTSIGNPNLEQLLSKARDAHAAGKVGAMSTGEALAVALILNRPDWLQGMNFTIAEALERIGPELSRLVPAVARQFERDSQDAAYATAEKARQARDAEFVAQQKADGIMDFSGAVVGIGDAPGYRDVRVTFDLKAIGDGLKGARVAISISPQDGETLVRHISGVHRFAWDRSGSRPLDATPDERRPVWIDART